jgi:hypothetical protein
MGWEGRTRGGLYYTRSRRVGGRIVREYVGTGEAAEVVAQLDALERDRRWREALLWQEERACYAAADAALGTLGRVCDELLEQELMAAGYHRHNRGEWRRRRHGSGRALAQGGSAAGDTGDGRLGAGRR